MSAKITRNGSNPVNAEMDVTKTSTAAASKPLLGLGNESGGGSAKLARAFQRLVGNGSSAPVSPAFNTSARRFLNTLTELGFSLNPQTRTLSHPLTPDRIFAFPYLSDLQNDNPEHEALRFASNHLPELEFYLPYISLQSRLATAQRQGSNGGQKLPLPPEPEYDEDGFLTDNF